LSAPKIPTQNRMIQIVLVFGLVLFVVYLAFFVNLQKVAETLATTNIAIYSGAFIAYILYTLCASLAWQGLLRSVEVKVTHRKAFLFTWVGLFFDATVPQLGWSAEVSKTYLLSKDSHVEAGKIGASVVGQKLITNTMTVVALSVGIVLALFRYSLDITAGVILFLVLALSILTLAVMYYASVKPSATKTLLNWAIKIVLRFRKNWNPQNFNVKAQDLLSRFHSGIAELKANPKALIAPVVASVIGFVFEVSVMFLTFAALGQPLPIDAVLIVFTLTGTLQAVGVALFGLPEFVMSVTFQSLGITAAVAVSVALLTRVVNLWFRIIISYGALQYAGVKMMRQNKTKDQP
jgi:uncharacterized protein (TIRG00374 family)